MNIPAAVALLSLGAFAQAPPAPIQEPWDGVPAGFRTLPIGHFKVPANMPEWKAARGRVKSIVVRSLGDLPPRPSPVRVKTVSVEKKDGYSVEKFVFHNGVDSDVPGYIAIPNGRKGKLPDRKSVV